MSDTDPRPCLCTNATLTEQPMTPRCPATWGHVRCDRRTGHIERHYADFVVGTATWGGGSNGR